MVDAAGHEHDGVRAPGARRRLQRLGEDDDLERALQILEGGHGHRRSRLGDHRAHARDDTADDHALLVELLAKVAAVGGHEAPDRLGDVAQRVVGEIEAEQLLLPAQAFPKRSL